MPADGLLRSVRAAHLDVALVAVAQDPNRPRVAADFAVLNQAAGYVGLDVDFDLLEAVRAIDEESIFHVLHTIAMSPRAYRAGESLEDYCRACKMDRMHTAIAVDQAEQPLRVECGYCRSQHNYRGGPRVDPSSPAPASRQPSSADARARTQPDTIPVRLKPDTTDTDDLVSGRERTARVMPSNPDYDDLERVLRRIIREEAGLTAVAPAQKWRGGTLVLRPAAAGVQEKSWPIETFFNKVVMLRNRLRSLEQQVNASALPDDVKAKLQGYVSGCYGSLTSFNVLFAEEEDRF